MNFSIDSLKKSLAASPLLLAIVLCIAPLPAFYLLSTFYSQAQALRETEESLARLQERASALAHEKQIESKFLAQIRGADPFYLDKQVESLTLLGPEIARLRTLPEEASLQKKRLQHLEHSNRLLFVQQQVVKAGDVQEVEEKQKEPVEMNEEDLKKFLSLIETSAAERSPQLIIKHFDLLKKRISSHESVFVIDTQLIKRENSVKK